MTESPDNTTITPSFITDSLGGQWSITPSVSWGAQVCHDGIVDVTTSHVSLLLYEADILYHQNLGGDFYGFQNSVWTLSPDPRKISPVLVESSDNTVVTTLGTALVDANLEKWTLVASASSGNQVACNGVVDSSTNSVSLLLYKNHRIYQHTYWGGWWYKAKSSDAWTPVPADPRFFKTA